MKLSFVQAKALWSLVFFCGGPESENDRTNPGSVQMLGRGRVKNMPQTE